MVKVLSTRNPEVFLKPVLSGCGVYDGSEVHESSAVLVHLSRAGADISMFAPDVEQMHAIDHTKGEPMENNRNVLVESARIARGNISALSNLTSSNFDAVVFPGGFGAAKNLSTFAVDGPNMKVNDDVERVIRDFHTNKKPIGLCCIAPVLAAHLLPGCEVTVGNNEEDGGRWPYAGTAGAIQTMGSFHVIKDVSEAHTDKKNKIVTTPAFMCETKFHEIFDGIGKMIDGVIKLL
ncbi:glutamine amidotransferase-like class 1 domain-containing protein 3, mitochondrial isoform X2 [Mercenaria mercenaria]|uniref:glutamine amidotransferase-like class 1 domain-containing protein 3, mitochondrial isoform X2 n=1 Tax=Mercenaria mercenaria TaxID=6596 RepID=UPI00234E86D4|nr:glutamine amidotransferase-like class 1 domain-containing protein 3, mitochondrial isoform X2 [Mercenaria mercenaria]